MKFRLTQTHRYWWPVTVRLPATDLDAAGTFAGHELQVQFEPQTVEAAKAAMQTYVGLVTVSERVDHEISQLIEVVRDWDGVIDDDGKPVPFSTEVLRQALGMAWFRAAVFAGLLQSVNGEEARRGN